MPFKSRDILSENYNYNQADKKEQESQTSSLLTLSNCVSNNVLSVSSSGGGGGASLIKGNDGNDGSGTERTIKTDSNGKLQTHDAGLDAHLVNLNNKINSDGTGALIVRLDNGNDSVRIAGQNSVGSNKGVGVEDTDGAILSGAKVVIADPTSSDGSRQVLRMNVKNELLVNNSKITQGEGDITGGGNGLQQILCYGKDQSGNLDPLNVDNNGHLKITLNDIEAGILNSINTHNTNKNTNTQVLSGVNVGQGFSTQSTAIETINNNNVYSDTSNNIYNNSVVIYIDTGANTNTTNFSFEVHKSYDGIKYFLDYSFIFNPMGADVNANYVPAVVGRGAFDGRFIRVKVNNLSEVNTTSINAYIQQRH